MAIYKQNIVDIDLGKGQIHRAFLNQSIGMMDQQADHFGIRVFRDKEPVNLTGVSVQGVFMPPEGEPIAITGSTYTSVSGNTAEVILPQACYNYDGQFTLSIKLVDATNAVTGTMRIVDGMVDNTHASGTVAPTDAVPTYQEVLAVYAQMLEDVTDYESVVATQDAKIDDVKSALNFDEYMINAGQYTIKATDLESGQWSYSTKATNAARARTKYLIPVRAGMVITYSNTTFDTYFNVLETPTSQSYITNIGWKTDGNGIIPITVDGYLTFIIRKHSDTSATVNPSDYNSTVVIETAMKQVDDSMRFALAYDPLDLLATADKTTKTSSGVTFTWSNDKKDCVANGTASGSSNSADYILGGSTTMPDGFEPGETYYIQCSSENHYFRIAFYLYVNGEFNSSKSFSQNAIYTIPSNVTALRVVLLAEQGHSFSNQKMSNIGIFKYIPTEMLKEQTESVIKSVQTALADKNGQYIFDYVKGSVASVSGNITNQADSIVTKDLIYFDNEFVRLTVATGYTANIYFTYGQNTDASRLLTEGVHYFYGGKNVPVRIKINKTGITLTETTAVKIEKIDGEETYDIGCGIKGHDPAFDKGSSIVSPNFTYYNAENRYASAPIKMPKSGLRIGFNPKYHGTEYIYPTPGSDPVVMNYKFPSYRVMVLKKGDNGLVVANDNEDLEAVSNSGTYDRVSAYIPYVEDSYVIIGLNTSNALTGQDYFDLLYVTSGTVERGYCGVYNIMPTGLNIDTTNNSLDIHGGESLWYSRSAQIYYATVFRLREVRKIVCSPEYTLLAEIYQINDDRTIKRDSWIYGVWANEAATVTKTASGVSVIDLEQFDFDGFAIVAIQSKTTFVKTSTVEGYATKRWTTGLLGGYEDVRRSICVDYYNDVNVSYLPGMPSILEENIHKLCNWKIPEYGEGNYVEQGYTQPHKMDTMYNVVPAVYNGTFIANSLLMQVTAKSALTCVKNRNGRLRKMQRVEANQPGTDGVATLGNIGYGLTCTNFTSVIHGLIENYSSWAMCFGDNEKFDRIPFDYHDLSDLRPGDVLSKKVPALQISRTSDAHCMTVSSIVTINGVIRAINIIEGYAPYDRFRTYLDEAYYNVEGVTNWITDTYSFKNLENFKFINRIKPQYLKPIEEAFEMHPESTDVGTVMCDRGTDSIYGEHTQYVELSFKDSDVTTNLYLYKNGTQIATIPKSGAYTVHGLKLLNVASYLDGEGLYTVKTDKSNDVQETFYVKGDVAPMTYEDGIPELGNVDYPEYLSPEQIERNWTKLTLPTSAMEGLEWLEIRYGARFPEDPSDPGKETRNPYIKEPTFLRSQFVPDDPDNPTEWTITVPQFMPKTYPEFVPPTETYPVEPNWSAIKGIYRVYKTQYGTYHATMLGRVSSDYYGLD